MADIKAWKVTGVKMGANKRTHKVNLSREFIVREAAEQFLAMIRQEHPEAMIEIVYCVDGRSGV